MGKIKMGFKFLVEMGMTWEWDGDGYEVTDMGGIWYKKYVPAHL